MIRSRKLTDITSSEGNLSRFSYICNEIRNAGYVDEKRLYEICEASGISHPKVIGRHIHILKTLGLIITRERFYNVSSYGKVISSFFGNLNYVSREEKTIYFQVFFKNIFLQLYNMLKIVNDNENKCQGYRECFIKNVIDYFSLPTIQEVWTKKTLLYSINTYLNTGVLKRGIENKFETMLMWLVGLDLVSKKDRISLSPLGKRIYNEISAMEFPLNDEIIFRTSLLFFHDYINQAKIPTDYELIKKIYLGSIIKFSNIDGLGDIDAINIHVQIQLARDHDLYIDKKDISLILSKLQEEEIIRSFILDRTGRLSLIQIK